jgi:hypothetical protein
MWFMLGMYVKIMDSWRKLQLIFQETKVEMTSTDHLEFT